MRKWRNTILRIKTSCSSSSRQSFTTKSWATRNREQRKGVFLRGRLFRGPRARFAGGADIEAREFAREGALIECRHAIHHGKTHWRGRTTVPIGTAAPPIRHG